MIWSFALAAIGVVGLYLAGSKRRIGWAIGALSQVLWAAYSILTHQYGFLLSCVAYGWIFVRNYRAGSS